MTKRIDHNAKSAMGISRRGFLQGSAAVALTGAAAAAACKRDGAKATRPGGAGDVEVSDLRFGMIALTDCSPIVVAHEKGFFRKYGINATIVKGASWAAIRDSLSNGDIQGTHMLLGMPLASSLGLAGSPKVPMIAPWILNRNGQAITLKADLKGKVSTDPKKLKPLVDEAKTKGSPMSFAMTFPPGTHSM